MRREEKKRMTITHIHITTPKKTVLTTPLAMSSFLPMNPYPV